MAQNTTVSLAADTWTLLTDSNVSTATFQNNGLKHVLIKGVNGTTTPTDELGAIRYNPGQGERNASLADLFPGVSGANRLFAWTPYETDVFISHA